MRLIAYEVSFIVCMVISSVGYGSDHLVWAHAPIPWLLGFLSYSVAPLYALLKGRVGLSLYETLRQIVVQVVIIALVPFAPGSDVGISFMVILQTIAGALGLRFMVMTSVVCMLVGLLGMGFSAISGLAG